MSLRLSSLEPSAAPSQRPLSRQRFGKDPVVRRAVLKFMIACQGGKGAGANSTAAAGYVEAQRKQNGQAVAEAEELLKLDGGK